MKLSFTFRIIGCTLLTLLTPTILYAQTSPYGTTRRPHTCPSRVEPKAGAPSAEQAKMYFLCDVEEEIVISIPNSFLRLVTDLTIQVAPISRPFNMETDGKYLGIDPKQPVYDIRGSYTDYFCKRIDRRNIGKNCIVSSRPNQQGICFRNTFGDWHCHMIGTKREIGKQLPPPTN
ncbi:hypothetical protein I8748_19570 [Nostoc sp. CENA67]|uniref:Uncharacterized protein n=1 Tax=Amazonocrinis nigriterrae CENA67 TaxID=2794033 RepID=A0A8J7HQX7_9NOST|nr:hypothetical protein [Amazonocrinis nigriterrae CENA67]